MDFKAGSFVLFTLIIAGVQAATPDYRNETIKCIFDNYARCYRDIPGLAANFTAAYDGTQLEINRTCLNQEKVRYCLLGIPLTCKSPSLREIPQRIADTVTNLCKNNSTLQQNFLNASSCYNRNQNIRSSCVKENDSGDKTDGKSLCCSNKKTLECMRDKFRLHCQRNVTDFQDDLMHIYRSHHSAVCTSYLKYCNGSSQLLSTLSVLLASILSFVLQKI